MSKFFVRRRARFNGISGRVNLPYGTLVDQVGDYLVDKSGNPMCMVTSRHSHMFFVTDEDGLGKVRGELVSAIMCVLKLDNEDFFHYNEAAWNKIVSDPVCQKYQKPGLERFIWSHDFYNGDVEDLRYINNLIGGK